jgi:hypothetical protein
MDSFYVIVLTVAIIFLIAILAYVGVKMTDRKSNNTVYPPVAQACPDYWVQVPDPSNKNNVICAIPPSSQANSGNSNSGKSLSATDTYGMNNPVSGAVNFSNGSWAANGNTATCNQKTWANKYNIQWDGISNYNSC